MKRELGGPPSTGSSSTCNNTTESVFQLPYSPPAFAYQPRTPVVSVHTNSYNISTVGSSNSYGFAMLRSEPWTPDEHQRFLDALETYGVNAQLASPNVVWHAIAQAVHTRAPQDVKEHAHQYLMQLQHANVQKRNEHLFMQSIDAGWTLEDDALFEHLLAVHATNDAAVCYPWELIAAKLPGKSPRDVQERYYKLCYDIARIETGHHVEIHYGGRSAHNKAQVMADNASSKSSSVSLSEQAQGWDCIVTLTPEEESILITALEQASEPLQSSPELLQSIASAVTALTNVRNKIPPQRASALFTLDEARAVIQDLLRDMTSPAGREHSAQCAADPQGISEQLSVKRSGGQLLKPLTTAGLVVGDAPPAPLYNSAHFLSGPPKLADASQRGATAEDLLGFRAASSGNSSSGRIGSDPTQRQPQSQQTTALSSAASPYNLRSRDHQPLSSPSSSSAFPSVPLLSPLSHLVASFTPRGGEALGRCATIGDDLGGDAPGDRAAVKEEDANGGGDEAGDAAMRDFCM